MKRLAFLAAFLAAAATVLTPAVAAPKDPLVYVSMGDSYVSGPLVLPHDQRWVPQDCGQSSRNFAHIAAQQLNVDEFKDVSCGAATINDFARSQSASLGSPAAPQFDALNPTVDVVTVGIGGNDVGFVGLALGCMRLPKVIRQEPGCTPKGPDPVPAEMVAMGKELGVAIDEIHRRAPRALVLIISYPDALPDDAVGCYPYLPIPNEDMPYVVAKFKEMNATLKSTAALHDATYVDIYTGGIGHDACKPPALAWINGAVLVPPSFPAHPNDLSYINSAPVVAQAIQKGLAARQGQASTPSAPSAPGAAAPVPAVAPRILPRTGGVATLALELGAFTVLALALRRRFSHA